MGLIDLIFGVSDVFAFLKDSFYCLPFAVQILVYAAFGGVVFIAVMQSIWR